MHDNNLLKNSFSFVFKVFIRMLLVPVDVDADGEGVNDDDEGVEGTFGVEDEIGLYTKVITKGKFVTLTHSL